MRLYVLILLVWGFAKTSSWACGYNFVSGCPSELFLNISGTRDSFAIGNCPDEKKLHGLNFGKVRSFSLTAARSITWESCINNVTAVTLYYRLYEVGKTAPTWSAMDLPEYNSITEGPYTTRYRRRNMETNFTPSLVVGKKYVFEVYFRAEVDTIGDDFRPETFILQNNDGRYYNASFEYVGTQAPPFVLVMAQQQMPRCFGGNNAKVEVTAYGAPYSELFYEWTSPFSINFPIVQGLGAGNYKVRVRHMPTGYQDSLSFQITQPTALEVTVGTIQPITCNTVGSVSSVRVSGGTGPYQTLWNSLNGEPTFTTRGVYTVTATDANGCTATRSITVTGESEVRAQESIVLCQGQMYQRGNQVFTVSGEYNVRLPKTNGCDTLLTLKVQVLAPARTFEGLPDSTALTCRKPLDTLCARNAPLTEFTWSRQGTVVGRSFCQTFSQAGVYDLAVRQMQDNRLCTATKRITVRSRQTPLFQISNISIQRPNTNTSQDGSITVSVNGTTSGLQFLWSNRATTNELKNIGVGRYCVTIIDANRCSRDTCLQVSAINAVREAVTTPLNLYPNPAMAGQTVTLTLPVDLIGKPARCEVFNSLGQLVWHESVKPTVALWTLDLPPTLPTGAYTIHWWSNRRLLGQMWIGQP